ncbi:MAG TPA: prepilin-type N-terminal cleavage/methylation domain-containing protein [Planctomycetota bacterium]|nr:prepilin-type N-terminal cleavage/methylation domain-containing protein [Planctomycetota bacterium]
MIRAAPHRARRHAGYTLVEVMVVLLIMSSLLVTIGMILTSARTTRDVIHNLQENQLAGPAILDLVEADLRALHTFNREPRDVLRIEDRTISGLDADRIDFVAATNSRTPLKEDAEGIAFDLNEVGYVLRENPEQNDFLEIWRREDGHVDAEPFRGGEYVFLHDRVLSFGIEVFEEDGPDAEPLDEWGEEGGEDFGLPTRIEITLELELAPRILRGETQDWMHARSRMTYRRIVRFDADLIASLDLQPLPRLAEIEAPDPDAVGGAPGEGGECSNGAGLSSIGVSWVVLNSVFSHNAAIGSGANPARGGTPGGGSGAAIYADGNTFSVDIAGTIIEDNHANEGGGAVFFVSNDRTGTLAIDGSTLRRNPSAGFETAGLPGIFFLGAADPTITASTLE